MTTALITGPTRGLGRAATLATADRGADLLLVGRTGPALTAVADEARARGANVHEIGCDLSRPADVRAAAATARDLIDTGAVRPLLGSNTYSANFWRRLLHVPEARWRDPVELARPATGDRNPGVTAAGTAYSNAKLAVLYYAHELQRHVDAGVVVFEPGWMPGTALGRGAPAALQAMGRGLADCPASPPRNGPDRRWRRSRRTTGGHRCGTVRSSCSTRSPRCDPSPGTATGNATGNAGCGRRRPGSWRPRHVRDVSVNPRVPGLRHVRSTAVADEIGPGTS